MAYTIAKSGIHVGDLKSVGFFVIAPHLDRRSSRNTNLESRMRADSIRSAVKLRIDAYEYAMRAEEAKELRVWESDYFHPLVDRLIAEDRLKVLCWDDALLAIASVNSAHGDQLMRFYERCLSFEPLMAVPVTSV